MEQRIENAIDNALDSIAPQLYICSIAIGIVLIILGLTFIMLGKQSNKKVKINTGLICLLVGIVSVISSIIQMP